uniref:Peroxisomal membrane protein PEX14-like KPWE domain-containing protein n=1 Tax=Aquila chrysaetos chrysaetos TaxID=223781 RepID=A0A663F9J9_AQUCH
PLQWHRPPSPPPSGPVPPPPPPAAPSFAEVLRLIQNGQEPPGLRHPRASPTGDSPTASRLPPPTKPWENRTASAGARSIKNPHRSQPSSLEGAVISLDFHTPHLNS